MSTKLSHWDIRFLGLAKHVADWSKDPSTQTGAIIVDASNRIISVGFNGFPRGVTDDDRLDNRDVKYEMVVHCEANAILFAQRDLTGCTLYTYPFMSCSRCAAFVIQSGITLCVAPICDNVRWLDSFQLARQMFTEAGVTLKEVKYE